jgi:hypothetical protein
MDETAGVDNDDVGVAGAVVHHFAAHFLQLGGNHLGVHIILGATEGDNIDSGVFSSHLYCVYLKMQRY